jgi:hypothetical protein
MAHLPVQDVVIEPYSDGLSASDLPKMLAKLLKTVGYNHTPFYLGTWGPTIGGEPIWYVHVALYEKHLSFGVLVILHTYYAAPSASFNDGIWDVSHQALTTLCEEIHQDRNDKQVRRITEKCTQKLEDLQAWGRSQEMKIQELQDQNATQVAIIKELREQLEKIGQEVSEHEPMMEPEEDPQKVLQATPTLPIFPQPNLYEQLIVIFESCQVKKNKS